MASEEESASGADKRAYITQSYRSPYATLNPLWAAARTQGYVPDVVHLLTPQPDVEAIQRLVDGIEALQDALGKAPDVKIVEDDPEDFQDTADTVSELVTQSRQDGYRVAVDVTPGRTIPKLALFQVCLKMPHERRPDHLFYLSVPSYDYRPDPYVKIPFRLQELKDLAEEVYADGP